MWLIVAYNFCPRLMLSQSGLRVLPGLRRRLQQHGSPGQRRPRAIDARVLPIPIPLRLEHHHELLGHAAICKKRGRIWKWEIFVRYVFGNGR